MKKIGRRKAKHLGEMRTSQLVTSYGVGAVVDFRDETAILAGADKWYSEESDSDQERVIHCHNLEKVLNRQFFVVPKWNARQYAVYQKERSQDIGAYRFPHILYCPRCYRLISDEKLAGFQSGALKCPDCGHSRLVPSRFIVVCGHGHLDDFPYDAWVHNGRPCPKRAGNGPNLKLKNIDGRNSIGSLQVICEDCGEKRSMQGALVPAALKSVYACSGRRPWLEKEYAGGCSEDAVARLRTAAGVYMPVNVSALNIPPWSTRVSRVLQRHMAALEGRTDEQAAAYIKKHILPRLPGINADIILDTWKNLAQKDQEDRPQNEQQLYEDEYMALRDEAENSDSDFCSIQQPVPGKYANLIQSVFAVTKLTEVVAMLGFTRLRSWDGDYNSPALAPIFSRKNTEWLPAAEQRGEGIFMELDERAVQNWEQKNAGVYRQMIQNAAENHFRCPNISARYVLLHTLSHLLIRALAVNCGYQTASMKERVYSTYQGGRPMAGILIYTTAADTEGSLGGLVGQAEAPYLEAHLDALLNEAGWCSSDPLCLTSSGKNAQGLFGLNYAACPQCTLLPETACTMRNSLLDRGALIGREQDATIGFFSDVISG